MDLGIQGKKAIMAGGSAGMGRATAERLAEAGCELTISARREPRLRQAAKEIAEKYGVSVTPVVADSSTEEGRNALFTACPDPDILSITIKPPDPNGDVLKVTADMWRGAMETALIGPIEIMRHYIPGMKERGWGRIVNIATFSAKNPMIWRLLSGPARSALINYTASVSRHFAKYGVIMNNILPGMFATEGMSELSQDHQVIENLAELFELEPTQESIMEHFRETNVIPTGFMGDADDLAPMAAFLCSERARYIVGQNIVIDGGQYPTIF